MSQARNWTFTLNNPTAQLQLADYTFYIYSLEEAPTTHTRHYQGYIQFKSPKRLTQLKKIIPDAHWELARGSPQQNIDYCSKPDSHIDGPWTDGRPTKQGKRSDLIKAAEAIDAGYSMKAVALESPSTFIRYHQGLYAYKQITYQPVQREIRVDVFIGEPGTGKTRFLYDHYSAEDIYKLNPSTNGTLWFDGYDDQKILLIDDFNGWIRYQELLTILDRYPYRCQIKGSSTMARWTYVVITSNTAPETWYLDIYDKDRAPALTRRINNIFNFPLNEPNNNIEDAFSS